MSKNLYRNYYIYVLNGCLNKKKSFTWHEKALMY